MRHKMSGRKLGRRDDHRRAMLKNMAESLITHGRIETTVTRAKEVRSLVEKLITIARRGDLHSRRIVFSRLHTKEAVKRLLEEVAPRYKDRNGGYTRILKTRFRRGDASPMAILELVEEELPPKKKKATKKKVAKRTEAVVAEASNETTVETETEAVVETTVAEEALAAEKPADKAEEPAAEAASAEPVAEEPKAASAKDTPVEAAVEEVAEKPEEKPDEQPEEEKSE